MAVGHNQETLVETCTSDRFWSFTIGCQGVGVSQAPWTRAPGWTRAVERPISEIVLSWDFRFGGPSAAYLATSKKQAGSASCARDFVTCPCKLKGVTPGWEETKALEGIRPIGTSTVSVSVGTIITTQLWARTE